MNANRRKELAAISARVEQELGALRDALVEDLESARDEEQEYLDNMPESIQQGEKGQNASEAITALEDAISTLEDFDIESITGSIEEASA